jgi:dTDP-4-amino-4,6-dideoxygalactose transaminase
MIPYTKPFLPPLKDYQQLLEGVWNRNWLTNMGPLEAQLEKKLADYLGIPDVVYVSSATAGLQIAIEALQLTGEIITTPVSFVATSSSIVWQHCKPVYADIDRHTWNPSIASVEKMIGENTSAILVAHLFGNPAGAQEMEALARKHGLKLIFDAAHAFGVRLGETPVMTLGDVSVCSLHATKLYHTTEGGLIFSSDKRLLDQMRFMRNFGFNGPANFTGLGTNAKNSELHAAMGLANFPFIPEIIRFRKELAARYDALLHGFSLERQQWPSTAATTHGYYPVLFSSEKELEKCVARMNENAIYARRYFFPPLSQSLPYIKKVDLPVCDDVAARMLCLPMYYGMTREEVSEVCDCFKMG